MCNPTKSLFLGNGPKIICIEGIQKNKSRGGVHCCFFCCFLAVQFFLGGPTFFEGERVKIIFFGSINFFLAGLIFFFKGGPKNFGGRTFRRRKMGGGGLGVGGGADSVKMLWQIHIFHTISTLAPSRARVTSGRIWVEPLCGKYPTGAFSNIICYGVKQIYI